MVEASFRTSCSRGFVAPFRWSWWDDTALPQAPTYESPMSLMRFCHCSLCLVKVMKRITVQLLARARLAAADIVMKSRVHQDSKYRAGVPVIDGSNSEPLGADASPLLTEGL